MEVAAIGEGIWGREKKGGEFGFDNISSCVLGTHDVPVGLLYGHASLTARVNSIPRKRGPRRQRRLHHSPLTAGLLPGLDPASGNGKEVKREEQPAPRRHILHSLIPSYVNDSSHV